jgi:hypothetical protein
MQWSLDHFLDKMVDVAIESKARSDKYMDEKHKEILKFYSRIE